MLTSDAINTLLMLVGLLFFLWGERQRNSMLMDGLKGEIIQRLSKIEGQIPLIEETVRKSTDKVDAISEELARDSAAMRARFDEFVEAQKGEFGKLEDAVRNASREAHEFRTHDFQELLSKVAYSDQIAAIPEQIRDLEQRVSGIVEPGSGLLSNIENRVDAALEQSAAALDETRKIRRYYTRHTQARLEG